MKVSIELGLLLAAVSTASASSSAFVVPTNNNNAGGGVSTQLHGWFDNFSAGGTGNSKESLDEQWEAQQKILAERRKPKSERDLYFKQIEERRKKASVEREEKWGWQTKNYKKGEDPINEWKKRRANGSISDLEDQYGDPKKIGGIPIPMASFGVGGEFGVGGKYDNGGRFDLRLPYADQGYVDDDADFMGKLFGGGKNKNKKSAAAPKAPASKKNTPPPPSEKKKGGWPW